MEANKALLRRFFEEAWIERNPTAVDEFMPPTTWSTQAFLAAVRELFPGTNADLVEPALV